jgi:hypothetical protein
MAEKININNYIKKEYGTTSEVIPTSQDYEADFISTSLEDTNQFNIPDLPIATGLNRYERQYGDWNKVTISNDQLIKQVIPGVATVKVDFSKEIKKDKKPGYDYTKVKDYGANSKQISISIKMNGIDYALYKRDIVPMLQLKTFSNKEENIIYIENQMTLDYGIEPVLLESVSSSSPEVGITVIELVFVEAMDPVKQPYVNFPKANVKNPTATVGSAAKKNPTADGKGKH